MPQTSAPNRWPRRRVALLGTLVAIAATLTVLHTLVKLNIEGDLQGLYLLRGSGGPLLELRDDVYLGEAHRIIGKLEFGWLHDNLLHRNEQHATPHLDYRWNAGNGHGYIHDINPDGTEFVTCLSRFLDSSGRIPRGLFVGGELPTPIYGSTGVKMNETGMAFKKGGNWYHIWCNANEGIAGAASPTKMIYPSEWEFKGSKVLFSSTKQIVIKSSHWASLDGAPVAIDRFLFHTAGDHFITLAIRVTNLGEKPTGFYYVYGDEPWLGDYGTSAGNVGWSGNKLYFYAGTVDPIAYSTAGMADLGNPLSPYEQGRTFSGLANFISWIGMVRPSIVYFANKEGDPHDESEHIPLDSPNNRVIFCQWGPISLPPKQSTNIVMAIGLANRDAKSGRPMQPDLHLNCDEMNRLMETR